MNCYITVVYGYNTGDKRKELWTNLRDLAIGMTTPWLICGDFNALLYPEDRLYGDTWTNKQKGSDRICSRIDKALGNFEWMI
ncbi:hypothetical protein KY289_030240 [Solanum tuberosum]|nr:hypothetical protein KY289_030240 [Solanum tuberosum]